MKRKYKNKLIIFGLTLAEVFSLYGCARNNCDIEVPHVHEYISSNGFKKYNYKEYRTLPNGYIKTDEVKEIEREEYEYYRLLENRNLLSIEDNYEYLKKYFPKLPNVIEYEYEYDEIVNEKRIRDEYGNIIDIEYKYETKTNWTTIPNDKKLTGNIREVTYAYRGYKILYDEATNSYYPVLSACYNTIDELIEAGYTHVRISSLLKKVDVSEVVDNKILALN